MTKIDLMRQLSKQNGGKIVLLVMDGLGGLPADDFTQTSLEHASTPNLDRLAREGCQGLSNPIGRGITPGSGPAHLALFGYDPVASPVGRGVLSALGVGFDLGPGDVAARGNFCTVDSDNLITDRRAGRISSELALPLVNKLNQIKVPGVKTFVRQVKEYRFMVVFRGDNLSGALEDTDPQAVGKAPLAVTAKNSGSDPSAANTAQLFQLWVDEARALLRNAAPANMVTLRGFGQDPQLPKFAENYQLTSACVAVYPMYKGVSRLVGMDILDTGSDFTPEQEFGVVANNWTKYDFFFVHIKPTDSRGEDGNFEAKAAVIGSVDKALPILTGLKPDVLIVTGDHSTPARLMSHSWHPVPTLLWAPKSHLTDETQEFGERNAQRGGLGHFQATDIMPLALAHALRLEKYGA